MGQAFGADSAPKTAYLKRMAWAKSPDDVFWGRSRLGLPVSEIERTRRADALEACEC